MLEIVFFCVPAPDAEDEEDPNFSGLNNFSDCLSKFTRYSNLRPLATLSYTTDMFNNASIVSSIEFDKDKVCLWPKLDQCYFLV